MRRYNKIIILISLLIGVVLVVSVIYSLSNNEKREATGPTGGSGSLPAGSLVLSGLETPVTNSPSNLSIGRYLSSAQQRSLNRYLEALLYNEKPLDVYRGTIVAESPKLDYQTNILTFNIQIIEPDTTFVVHYKITELYFQVFDKNGKELTPPKN